MRDYSFSLVIEAPPSVVWRTMLEPATYRLWTAEFSPGSYFEGAWTPGARIRFLGPEGDGMTAEIVEARPHEFVSIRHLGVVHGFLDDTSSEEVRGWAPAKEEYSFTNVPDGTLLRVRTDLIPGCEDVLADAWPRALARLKQLCESAP